MLAHDNTLHSGDLQNEGHLFLFISNPLSGIVTGPKWLPAPSSEIGQLMTDHWSSHGRCTSICII